MARSDRVRLEGDSCLVCGFALPKGVWVGSHPEWYVCEECRRKVQMWPQVETLYRAALKFTDWLNSGEWNGHPSRWPKDDHGNYYMGHEMPKALDPFRYLDKADNAVADAIDLLQREGFGVKPGPTE